MRSTLALALAAVLGLLAMTADQLPADDDQAKTWDFDSDTIGSAPTGFTVATGAWGIVEANGGRALMQQGKNADATFNVILIDDTNVRDVDLNVRFLAIAGEIDRGGGLVWRARDGKNYLIARYNPLEDNFRLYTVVDGKRTQLGGANIPHSDGWHTLRVTMQGDHIQCFYDSKKYLDAHNTTFPESGRIGLWTKADAQTQFDDLTLRQP